MMWRLALVAAAVICAAAVGFWLAGPGAGASVALVAAGEAARRAAKRARAAAPPASVDDGSEGRHARWSATDDANAAEVEAVRSESKRSRLAELRARLSRRG